MCNNKESAMRQETEVYPEGVPGCIINREDSTNDIPPKIDMSNVLKEDTINMFLIIPIVLGIAGLLRGLSYLI